MGKYITVKYLQKVNLLRYHIKHQKTDLDMIYLQLEQKLFFLIQPMLFH